MKEDQKNGRKNYFYAIEICVSNGKILMEEYKNITISALKFKENLCNELLKGYKKIDELDENKYSHISFILLAFRNRIHNIRKVKNQRIRCHLCYIKNKKK